MPGLSLLFASMKSLPVSILDFNSFTIYGRNLNSRNAIQTIKCLGHDFWICHFTTNDPEEKYVFCKVGRKCSLRLHV